MRWFLLSFSCWILCCGNANAGDLAILPGSFELTNRADRRTVLVCELEGARVVVDRTPKATFESSDPKIAKIEQGELVAVSDGTVTLLARFEGKSVSAKVVVRGVSTPKPISFRNDVLVTLTRTGCNSGACHGALAGKGGLKLSLRGYDPESDYFVLTRQALGRRIDFANPDKSLVLQKALRELPHGGGRRIEFESRYHDILLNWVRQGAPGVMPKEPTLDRIELFPKSALLSVKATLRVIAIGHYTDGTTREVTRFTKFGSSEEPVATVDEDGRVTVVNQGEAAITASFDSRVATATVTVPFAKEVKVPLSANASVIDREIARKLELLGIPPSGRSTDREFIRRITLDLCGVLPTIAEVNTFTKDTNPKKREKLIESLLARPEYVDYWAHKWSDLLLVSSKKLPQPAVWAFYQKLRQSVAQNHGWDRVAREILTATGSNFRNGAGSYFVIHKDITDLVESTTVTFLGTSINCCRCHNHPLEKWTQDEYWSMANLFGRVSLKAGEKAQEVSVLNVPVGNVLHLRRGIAMTPTPLGGEPMPADSTIDRRAYLANWLTNKTNPYFAKAMVNRVWRNFFGRGLVEAEDDLRETNPATNPELFDALAEEFIKSGYDIQHLIRLIANSDAYQRSSAPLAANAADDRFYSRYFIRRLSAEVILDAYSEVTAVPTPFTVLSLGASGGTAASQNYPLGTRAMQLPDSLLVSQFLDAFGRPERSQTCSCERTSDSSVTQALHLNNGQTLNDKLRNSSSQIGKWISAKASNETIISELYQHALGREPSAAEMAKVLPILNVSRTENDAMYREAIEDFAWAVLTSREFLFNK